MPLVNAVIDGKSVAVPAGSTILQAARSVGARIPVLCDFPGLEIAGCCRICLVEAEGNPRLLAACCTPLAEGMVVHTRTPKVLEVRRTVLELLLVRHPLDCFACASNGRCLLQDLCYELGVERSPYRTEETRFTTYPLDDANPFYVRDRNKCVLCGRCVRVCDARAQYHAVDFQNRGIETMVDIPPEFSLEESSCVFCGQCVQACPVGALAEKPAYGRGREWELDDVKTICSYCGVGCELIIRKNRATGQIANVTSDPLSPTGMNRGRTCVKGRFAWQFVHHPDRLVAPLVKEDGVFREASWDEALEKIAAGIQKIKGESGPRAIGFFASARCTNEENYLMQRLAREVVGTNNVDHCAHL